MTKIEELEALLEKQHTALLIDQGLLKSESPNGGSEMADAAITAYNEWNGQ